MFKVIKEYPDCRHFTTAVDGILAMAHKIDAKTLAAIVDAMQRSFDTMTSIVHDMTGKDKKSATHPAVMSLMEKRLACVFASIEISSKASFLEEMEEKVSITCLYRLLQDIVKIKFPLSTFKPIRRVKFVGLIEKLFLTRKHVSLDCLAAFIKQIFLLLTTMEIPDNGFAIAMSTFCYLSIHKHQKLRNLLEEDNEGYGLNMYDQFNDDPYSCNAMHTTINTEVLKLLKFDIPQVVSTIDRIVKRLPPTGDHLSARVAGIYAKHLAIEDEVEQESSEEADGENDGGMPDHIPGVSRDNQNGRGRGSFRGDRGDRRGRGDHQRGRRGGDSSERGGFGRREEREVNDDESEDDFERHNSRGRGGFRGDRGGSRGRSDSYRGRGGNSNERGAYDRRYGKDMDEERSGDSYGRQNSRGRGSLRGDRGGSRGDRGGSRGRDDSYRGRGGSSNDRGGYDRKSGGYNRNNSHENFEDVAKKYFDRKRQEDTGPHFTKTYRKRDTDDSNGGRGRGRGQSFGRGGGSRGASFSRGGGRGESRGSSFSRGRSSRGGPPSTRGGRSSGGSSGRGGGGRGESSGRGGGGRGGSSGRGGSRGSSRGGFNRRR